MMKKLFPFLIICYFLAGCSPDSSFMDNFVGTWIVEETYHQFEEGELVYKATKALPLILENDGSGKVFDIEREITWSYTPNGEFFFISLLLSNLETWTYQYEILIIEEDRIVMEYEEIRSITGTKHLYRWDLNRK